MAFLENHGCFLENHERGVLSLAEVGSVPRRALLNDEQQGAGWPSVAYRILRPFAQSPAELSRDGDTDQPLTSVWDSMGGGHDHDHGHGHGHTTAPSASPSASPTPCTRLEDNVDYVACINTPATCTSLYAPPHPTPPQVVEG